MLDDKQDYPYSQAIIAISELVEMEGTGASKNRCCVTAMDSDLVCLQVML